MDLDNPQAQLLLLRSCLGVPKFNYTLRTVRKTSFNGQLLEFDSVLHSCLQRIAGFTFTPGIRELWALPMSRGGFGFPVAADIADLAFLASLFSTQTIREGLSLAPSVFNVPQLPPAISVPELGCSQQFLKTQYDDLLLKAFLANNPGKHALLIGRSQTGAS